MLIEMGLIAPLLPFDVTLHRTVVGVSMLTREINGSSNQIVVRPPGFEPGTRGWKPLVITPSLQALELGGLMTSLNRFGILNGLKRGCLNGYS